ncbi:MAG: pteridine reductase [Rhodospirillaceae bacterium]|nr:pteridine reductase [Rhodospirillaceae bacterium]
MAPYNGESLEGRWALVTGAARRIGAVIAEALHEAGAGVIIHYLNSAEPADALADRLNGQRAESALTVQCDLRETSGLERMLSKAVDRSGRLDVLVNNASSFYPTPAGSITVGQWHDLIGTNLKAPLFLSQAALPHLRETGGTIINIVDVHWQRPLRDHPVYGAAKAGLAMLTRSLAKDLGPDIRVNGISPGAILWPEAGLPERTRESIIRQIPLKRPGEPRDIATAVLFLVRDAPYVNGHILAVDGGRSVGW